MAGLLRDIAYVRSGDKGDMCTIGVIATAPEHYDDVLRTLRPDAIRDLFGDWARGDIDIHRMDNIHAVVVTLHRALGGGATSTLRLDQTGKSLGNAILRLAVPAQ